MQEDHKSHLQRLVKRKSGPHYQPHPPAAAAKRYNPSNARFLVWFNLFIFFHCLSLKSFRQFPCLSPNFWLIEHQIRYVITTGNNLSRYSNVMQIQSFQSFYLLVKNWQKWDAFKILWYLLQRLCKKWKIRNIIFFGIMLIEDFLTMMKEILNEWRLMSICFQRDLSGCGTRRGKDRLTTKEMGRIK